MSVKVFANKLLKFAAKNAAGQLLAGFANNTRNCPLAGRYVHGDSVSSKKTFLVCCDYGTGGIWFLVDAFKAQQINELRHDFFAFEDKPDWMSVEDKAEYVETAKRACHHWDIDNLDWLSKFE